MPVKTISMSKCQTCGAIVPRGMMLKHSRECKTPEGVPFISDVKNYTV